jgi:predicted secreted protein
VFAVRCLIAYVLNVLTDNDISNIWRQNLAGGAPKQITNFESGQIFDFDSSRDGKQRTLP